MKKIVVFFLLTYVLAVFNAKSQTTIPIGINTAGGIFDTLFDHLGHKYALSDLDRRSTKPLGGTTTVNAVPTQTCQSGYFTLYFAPGSIFTNSTVAQTVLCQVFADISTLINSNCPAGAINIYCTDAPATGPELAAAIPYMSYPLGPLTPNQGVLDNQVYKYLVSGINPYATLPLIINSNSFYYHGSVQMKPSANWNFSLTTTNIPAGTYDAYSVLLHEVMHALGFYTLLDASGASVCGSGNIYYSRFDQYLTDQSGNSLITSSTPSACPCNNLSFALSPTVISTATTGCNSDVTNCSTAVKYVSSHVNVPVYTPNCFESGSSLSHFEDMCALTATTDLGCASTTVSASLNNNLYYVMSNAQSTGPCFVKRHPKEEERWVLCDLGYSVNSVYSSTVAGSSHTYAGGACSGQNVWGINDGIVNNVYTFTANAGTSTVISIPISTIIANDSPNTTTISCVDLIGGNVTWSLTGSNLTFTANSGYTGPVIFRYMPKNSGSSSSTTSFGGPVYIFAYFIPGNCPPNSCDMVTNGGFESFNNVWPAFGCGGYDQPFYNILNCWIPHTLSPDVWRRGCTGGNLSASAPGETHNGSPNDIIVDFQTTSGYEERIMNSLSSPLIPGQVYNLSIFFWSAQTPFVLSVYSTPQFIAGASYSPVAQFTIIASNTWTNCSTTFTFNSAVNHNAIVIGGDHAASMAAAGGTNYSYWTYIDDVSILPATSPTFVIPNSALCGNTTYTNLAQYASPIAGTFSGSFVTAVTNSAGTQYNFNSSQTAPPGVYSIAFNYTLNGCANAVWQNITVAPPATLAVSGTTYICINSPASVALSSSLVCGTCTNSIYQWLPGNVFGATQTVSPTSTTTYTAMAYNGTCTTTKTITVNLIAPTISLTTNPATICPGSTTTLTPTGSFTAGVWTPGGGTGSIAVTPTVTTTYSFSATNSLACAATSIITVSVQPLPTLSLISNTACGYPATVIATGSFSNVEWDGIPASPTLIVQPPGTPTPQVYSVEASNLFCNVTQTIAVFSQTSCCSPPGATSFTGTSICGTCSPAFVGPMLFPNSFTLQSGANLFLNGEFLIAPSVSITVQSGAQLILLGAHLYSCSDMWQGIVVESGGQVSGSSSSGVGNLIEDAVTALSVSNYTASTTPVLNFTNTVFNKNLVSVSVSDYTVTSAGAFKFDDCVFTCRGFTFTSTSWPQAGTSSPALRYAASSTAGILPPYNLQNAPVISLKNPYYSHNSHMAIDLNDVGVTTGVSYPTGFPGFSLTPSTAGDFTLFDAHENFISAVNSNVKINNCVFQNTQSYSVSSTSTVGAAVNHSTSVVLNFQLDMAAASSSVGNRFYDCHRAITGTGIFDFRLQHAIFRSTQSNTALTSSTFQSVGQQAVFLNTNQADHYIIENNEFTNVQSGVTINFFSANTNANMSIPYTTTWTVWPQTTYIGTVSVSNNTFCPELNTAFTGSTNRYVRSGVVMTSPYQHYIYTACGCNTVQVNNNLMYRVINGVRMDGLNSYTMSCRNSGIGKAIANNTVTLEEDFASNPQKAIAFTNSQSYPVNPILNQKVQTIENNVLSVYSGTAAISNQNITLMYLYNNGALSGSGNIYPSPHVLCNDLSYAYNGFVFDNFNQPVSWRGNTMSHLGQGMTLTNAGVIGQQGNSTDPIDNAWNGSWSGNWGTYVANSSTAQLSPLYVQSGLPWAIPSNSGTVGPQIQYGAPGTIFSATGGYSCGGGSYALVPSPLPNPVHYDGSTELLYIAQTAAYRFLSVNDSLRTFDDTLSTFYKSLGGSSIDLFQQTELNINAAQYDDASDILSGMDASGFIAPETNLYNFYGLYLKYKKAEDPFAPDDVTALLAIADLCPDINGQAVYQARALYQLAAGKVYNEGNSCLSDGSSRLAAPAQNGIKTNAPKSRDLDLFPNPAANAISIVGKKQSEVLSIEIKDLSGRTMFKGTIKTNDFFANLELNLINGAYLITISNNTNEKIIKKLLIAK